LCVTEVGVPEPVYIEQGSKRAFACSLAWPGWCRSGRDEAAALSALDAYAQRYAAVPAEAGIAFSSTGSAADIKERYTVVERVPGSGSTDFGVPDKVPDADANKLDAIEAERLATLLVASWRLLDRVVAAAPALLRKGPRGGGRDRDAIVDHVVESERSYARTIGVRVTPSQLSAPGGLESMRTQVTDVLRAAGSGAPAPRSGWPARYAARRFAWHVLDHAWEIEDKSDGG